MIVVADITDWDKPFDTEPLLAVALPLVAEVNLLRP